MIKTIRNIDITCIFNVCIIKLVHSAHYNNKFVPNIGNNIAIPLL